MPETIIMFLEFFKTGLFAVGGGLATIPFLMDMTEKYSWFTKQQLADMIAVAESTPGPIGVNTATFAGVQAFGIFGGLVSTFGLVLPSFIVIIIVYKILEKFRENKITKNIFYGLRPAVAGLISVAAISLLKTSISEPAINIKALVALIVFTFCVLKFKKLNPILVIVIGAALGIIFKF